jgi:aminopeptidase-like protein
MINGTVMYEWMKDLWPINRSLTGEGVRETLKYLKQLNPELQIKNYQSGEKVFDWEIPDEWNVTEAWVKDPGGNKIIDFSWNNLHLVGYSMPIKQSMRLSDLKNYLHTLPHQPNAIPYVTSYYKRTWGFCLEHKKLEELKDGTYEVYIDSCHKKGVLNFGEVYIAGESQQEILFSTYICHPSMANNELSGPVLASAIILYLKNLKKRKYSYRILLMPETIGSISYISKNFNELRKNVHAGFVLSCVGDEQEYSIINSRYGNNEADRTLGFILSEYVSSDKIKRYSFLSRGSDERQYCSPGVDLPFCGFSRSKYGTYEEYHTSLDNLDFVSPRGLEQSYVIMTKVIQLLERNCYLKSNFQCEPQLGKRGLYPNISKAGSYPGELRDMMNFLAYADGKNDLIDICKITGVRLEMLYNIVDKLTEHSVVYSSDE